MTRQTNAAWTADAELSVLARARSWLASPELSHLVATLGGDAYLSADPEALLDWSRRTLDTRAGRERHTVDSVDWPQVWIDAILEAAAGLGLLNTPPAQLMSYDLSIILGGTTLGNRLRTRLARDLLDGGVNFGSIMLLTAERPLSGRELSETQEGEATESANALRTADELLGPLTPVPTSDASVPDGQERLFQTRNQRTVRLLVATTTAGRPSTLDAIRFAVLRTPSSARERVLVLSSAIYAPFQFFRIAPVLLGAGTLRIELVGTPTDTSVDRRTLAQRLAQETHAAIHAATDLLAATGAL